jgi:hypothetical protein
MGNELFIHSDSLLKVMLFEGDAHKGDALKES